MTFEAVMASDTTKLALRGNMHMDTSVIKASNPKPDVTFKAVFRLPRPQHALTLLYMFLRTYKLNSMVNIYLKDLSFPYCSQD